MDVKERNVLEILQKNNQITAAQIASLMGMSEKTARTMIKRIKTELEGNGAEILSSPSLGYQLKLNDEHQFQSFLETMKEENAVQLQTSQQRILAILRHFLSQPDQYVRLDDLAELLHVSRSCLNRDLKEVKAILKKHGLALESKPNYGTRIVGSEFDLRICIAEFTMHHDQKDEIYENHFALDEIVECLNLCFQRNQFEISDFSRQNLVLHLIVAAMRIRQGNPVEMDANQLKELQSFKEYTIAQQISDDLGKRLHLQLPESETGYITIHLAAKKAIRAEQSNPKSIVIPQAIQLIVSEILDHIDKTYCLDLRQDIDLMMALSLHFITLDVRLRYELNLFNPILEDIRSRYRLAFMITQSCNSIIQAHYQRSLSDDEVAYIALHINLAIERLKQGGEKKNILILCSTGAGSSELLRYEYRKRFKDRLGEIVVSDPSQITNVDLEGIDYIFSTIHVNLNLGKPVILINPILQSRDVERINQMMNESSALKRFFPKELFMTGIKGNTPLEVLQKMSNHIKKTEILPDNFLELILKREELGVTNFHTQAVFPHPNVPCAMRTFVAIGILDKPILWNDAKVQFIYLFVLTKNEKEKELPLLYQATGELLTNEKAIRQIVEKKSWEYLMKLLTEIETRIGDEYGRTL